VATQRRFEADTLAEVLAKVQAEVGSDAKIASAQKVRSGGAFGFFQKERFEVLVDIPSSGPSAPPVAATPPPVLTPPTRQAQAAAAERIDDRAEWLASLQKSAGAPNMPTATVSGDIDDGDDDKLTPATLLELAQQINNEERANEQTVSTESGAFADVLSRMAFQADMRDVPVPRSGSIPRSGPMSHSPDGSLQSGPGAAGPIPRSGPMSHSPDGSLQSGPGAAGPPAPEDAAEVRDEPVIPERPAFLDQPVAEPAPVVAPVAREAVIVREEAPAAPVVRTRITDHPLAQLGLPAPYIPTGHDIVDLRAALVETLTERLPKIPVIRPSRGSIIAVVGEREEAQRIASDLAREFGRPKEEIVLASQHVKGTPAKKVLATVEGAEDAQRSWSRRQRPTFVAIDARPGTRDTSWAEHVLTALEPIATFGVLDATRKAEDMASWADALGGIDCLAITNIEETVSPASVLQTGIPVERIDGRKATPEFWALLLTERLPAA
jgi:hypothetical protein